MQDINYLQPGSIEELTQELSEIEGCIVAGGTDILPRMHKGFSLPENFIDISKISELRFINEDDKQVVIGALSTYVDIASSVILQKEAPVLCAAADSVGALQTRQRGTIGGSIGNASPAGDILIALLAMEARVVLVSKTGRREVPITEVFTGPGRTTIDKTEFIHSICFDKLPQSTCFFFHKIGKREAMACSVAGMAMTVVLNEQDTVQDARIALASVAPTPIRTEITEAYLFNKKITPEVIQEAARISAGECKPIDDVRGTANYRRSMIARLVEVGLKRAVFDHKVTLD